MPKTRDSAAYRLYINARKLWRSKIEWQLTRQEALSILHDVQAAANQGDWGARALMAYFYRSGLGPLDTNHVLDPNADKSVEIIRMAVAAGQAWATTISVSPTSTATEVLLRMNRLHGPTT